MHICNLYLANIIIVYKNQDINSQKEHTTFTNTLLPE